MKIKHGTHVYYASVCKCIEDRTTVKHLSLSMNPHLRQFCMYHFACGLSGPFGWYTMKQRKQFSNDLTRATVFSPQSPMGNSAMIK